jgi:hypothetical protein
MQYNNNDDNSNSNNNSDGGEDYCRLLRMKPGSSAERPNFLFQLYDLQ